MPCVFLQNEESDADDIMDTSESVVSVMSNNRIVNGDDDVDMIDSMRAKQQMNGDIQLNDNFNSITYMKLPLNEVILNDSALYNK